MQGKHMLSRTLDSLRKALSIHALSSALFTKLPLSLSYMYSILTCMCSPLITKPLESESFDMCVCCKLLEICHDLTNREVEYTQKVAKGPLTSTLRSHCIFRNLFSIGQQQTHQLHMGSSFTGEPPVRKWATVAYYLLEAQVVLSAFSTPMQSTSDVCPFHGSNMKGRHI